MQRMKTRTNTNYSAIFLLLVLGVDGRAETNEGEEKEEAEREACGQAGGLCPRGTRHGGCGRKRRLRRSSPRATVYNSPPRLSATSTPSSFPTLHFSFLPVPAHFTLGSVPPTDQCLFFVRLSPERLRKRARLESLWRYTVFRVSRTAMSLATSQLATEPCG